MIIGKIDAGHALLTVDKGRKICRIGKVTPRDLFFQSTIGNRVDANGNIIIYPEDEIVYYGDEQTLLLTIKEVLTYQIVNDMVALKFAYKIKSDEEQRNQLTNQLTTIPYIQLERYFNYNNIIALSFYGMIDSVISNRSKFIKYIKEPYGWFIIGDTEYHLLMDTDFDQLYGYIGGVIGKRISDNGVLKDANMNLIIYASAGMYTKKDLDTLMDMVRSYYVR